MKKNAVFFISIIIALLSLSNAGSSSAGEQGSAPARVAVLPFSMHTPGELQYLQDGIRDMLSSRLAWQGRVQIIDRTVTDQALRSKKGDMSLQEAVQVGQNLKADYVLFGSVTALGRAISIDAKMAPVSGGKEPVPVYVQAGSLDEVIPKINQSAQEINQKVFARSTDRAQDASSENELSSIRNPELLVPGAMVNSSDKISYINPNFIEITPESSLRQGGIWRSQTFGGAILGMDIGDVNGDKEPELVAVSGSKVTVYKREANGLRALANYTGSNVDNYIWVSVTDLNQDGKAEIHISNLRKINIVTGNTTNKVGYGQDSTTEASSLGLQLVGNKLEVLYKDVPYFLNAVDIPLRGKLLLGQKKGEATDPALKGDVYEMTLRGQTLAPVMPIPLPKQCNVFNFAKADVNNDNNDEFIVINSDNHLILLSASGDELWKSRQRFAATNNGFIGKITDLRFNQVDYYYLPSPILITDMNKDNIPEIVANRSPDYDRFMPEGIRYYHQGEIVSLSYDQVSLLENWKTRDIGGMVTAIRIADLNGDGTPELVASVVLAKDFVKLWESQSVVISYDLNISTQQAAAAKQQ